MNRLQSHQVHLTVLQTYAIRMHTTHSNTQYKNESKHSEMGPVRQNPIQRTVSLFICVCIALCRIVAHNIAQNRPDSFPPYPPDNHHCFDDVYLREGGGLHYCNRPYYPTARFRSPSSYVVSVEPFPDRSRPMSCKPAQLGSRPITFQ